MNWWIVLTIVIILINGFFVATEFALVKIRMSQLAIKVKEWNKNALAVQQILWKIDTYLSTTQLGITLCGLALWRIGGESVGKLILSIVQFFWSTISIETAESIAIPLAFIVLTIVQVVIGELIPKCLAIQNPMKYSLISARPLKILATVVSPFIWLLQKIYRFVLRLMWIQIVQSNDVHTEEELKLLLTESEEHGELKPSSNELIQNVFSFDDRQVRHIYTPRKHMAALDITWDIDRILDYVTHEGYSRYPIYEGSFDTMIWTLHGKDIMKYLVGEDTVTYENIRSILRPYHVVPLGQTIESLLQDMQTMHTHIAMVQNEFGEIIGMVTMEDIIEELIGDVQDETDSEHQPYSILENGTWMIQWHAAIDVLNDILPESIPEGEWYTTLAGYITHLRGRIPGKGELITDEFYEYRIENIRKYVIQWIHVQLKK